MIKYVRIINFALDPPVGLRTCRGGVSLEAVLARIAGSRFDESPDAQVRRGVVAAPPPKAHRRHESFTR